MPKFRVLVKHGTCMPDGKPFVFQREVKSRNVVHAAAAGLSMARWVYAESIEVTALQPVAGRSVSTRFRQCSQGASGFLFVSRT
jgi:hypothetical protein